MFNRLKKYPQALGFRLGFVYLLLTISAICVFKSNDAWTSAKAFATSRLMPDLTAFASYQGGYAEADQKIFADAKQYYEHIMKYSPPGADRYGAYSMLGFCNYYLGEKEKSYEYYQRAVEIAPEYFTLSYNLGAISFKEGKYQDAMRFLLQALAPSKEEVFHFITSSPIIFPFIQHRKGEDLTRELSERLRDAYRDTFVLLNQCCLHEKKYKIMRYNSLAAISMGLNADGVFTWQKGVALYHLQNYVESLKNAQELIALNPHAIDAYRLLADSLSAMGSVEKAALVTRKYMILQRSGEGESFNIDEIELLLF